MRCLKFYFFDASAIVKLLVNEAGTDKVKTILEDTGSKVHTSWVLLAEVLNVLKRKWLKGELSERLYGSAVYLLFSLIEEGQLHPIDLLLIDGSARLKTYKTELIETRKKHPDLDAADALQFIAIRTGILGRAAGESKPQLVTADKKLKEAADLEGICTIFVA